MLAILDEPVAAAIAYARRPESDENVFVFDLGGGTFDVTIISIKDGQIVPSAIRGDSRLGGKDWDDRIISYCAGQFQEQFGCNPLDDLRSYQDLQLQSIRAKEELSRRNRSRIPIHHEGHALTVELTREKFEELTLDLVDKCRGLCELALNEAGQTWADIDKILLVGGSTRMPMIVNMVRDISGKEPSMELHPDECVVQGAAWYALNRQEAGTGESPSTLRVKNITSHNLGVIALDEEGRERSFLQIPKGTPVPCEHRDDSSHGQR